MPVESSSSLNKVILGFISNPLEIILVIVGLLILLLIVLFVYVYGNRKRLKRKVTQSHRKFETALKKLSLTPSESDLLQKLYQCLPDWETKKHLLLASQSLFNLCASRLMCDQEVEEATLSSLRIKLGFRRQSAEKQIRSTVLLPTQIYLLIVQRETKKFYGKILISNTEGLVIEISDRHIIAPGVGTNLTCYFKTKSGTFHFKTNVLSLNGHTFRIAHSEKIERSQRRRYYRVKLFLEALIRLAGSEESLTPTPIVDLSGGGATLINPDRRFREGDDVQIVFETAEIGTKYSIVGEIIRLSKDGGVIHLSFGPLNESTRDRLISFVLNQRKKKMH
jgi:c-di-GMP-binding flagellar brake protein YcgR